MNRINVIPGEYNVIREDEIFPDKFVEKTARKFGFDKDQLKKVLGDTVFDFDDDGHFFSHLPFGEECRITAVETLKRVRDVRREWAFISDEAKHAIQDVESHAELMAHLDAVIAILQDASKFNWSRGRGNPGKGRKTADVDLRIFYGAIDRLYHYWKHVKKQPMGHEIEGPYYRKSDGGRPHNRPKSLGIKFALKCLKKLDNRISVESCKTLIMKLKAREKKGTEGRLSPICGEVYKF